MKLQLIIVPLLIEIINTQGQRSPSSPITRLTSADENLNILALPVGQGDATIIQCPAQHGGKLTVVDMGSSKNEWFMSKQDIAKYLEGFIIEKVFLSHPDKDHNNFLDAALRNLHPQYYPIVYHSCDWTEYRKYVEITGITTKRVPFCCGGNCPTFEICNGKARVAVLASEHNKCSRGGTNGDSLVLQVQFADVKVLLPGDFEGSKQLINNFLHCAGQRVQSHIFRLAHHGAFNGKANAKQFLEAVRPYYAFSSSGLHEVYHHPRCEVHHHLKTSDATHLDKNVAPHMYTCSTSSNEWDNRMITDGIYVTTVIDPDPTIDKVHNYVIHFAINVNGVSPARLIKFNSIPVSNIVKQKHQMLHELFMSSEDKSEDADEYSTT